MEIKDSQIQKAKHFSNIKVRNVNKQRTTPKTFRKKFLTSLIVCFSHKSQAQDKTKHYYCCREEDLCWSFLAFRIARKAKRWYWDFLLLSGRRCLSTSSWDVLLLSLVFEHWLNLSNLGTRFKHFISIFLFHSWVYKFVKFLLEKKLQRGVLSASLAVQF